MKYPPLVLDGDILRWKDQPYYGWYNKLAKEVYYGGDNYEFLQCILLYQIGSNATRSQYRMFCDLADNIPEPAFSENPRAFEAMCYAYRVTLSDKMLLLTLEDQERMLWLSKGFPRKVVDNRVVKVSALDLRRIYKLVGDV